MLNKDSNAETAADSSTSDEITTSAKLLPNPVCYLLVRLI